MLLIRFVSLKIICFLPLLSESFTEVHELVKKDYDQRNFKKVLELYLDYEKKMTGWDLIALKFDEAKVFWKDQNIERAFQEIIEALSIPIPNSEISQILEWDPEALSLYLDPNLSPNEMAEKLIDKYRDSKQRNPEVNYVLAVAEANLGNFESFFELFYQAFHEAPGNYLVDKTKATLSVRLHERAKTQELKEKFRQDVFVFSKAAQEKMDRDASLYKMMMAFSSDNQKNEIVTEGLKKIINNNIVVPRSDIIFFVTMGVDVGRCDLSQSFINKVREWYSYSRALDRAQAIIDKNKKA